MSGYRYNIIDHDGTQCLHVIVTHEAGDDLNGLSHTYIPVNDIMQSFAQHGIGTRQSVQGFASSILLASQNVVSEINRLEELHPDDLPADKAKALLQSVLVCFDTIVKVCQAQLVEENKEQES